MAKRILIGAIVGALFTAIDGAVVGLITKAFFAEDDTWRVVGLWTFCFALVGAILGAIVGALWKALASRLMLRAPTDLTETESSER